MPTVTPTSRSDAFNRAIKFVLPHETEYTRGHWGDDKFVITENNPKDPGGRTRYGIDQRSHPNVDVNKLSRADAEEIYWKEWIGHRLDLLPERLAIAAFDVYVNGGYPIRWLQRAYNSTHQDVKQLADDNQLGPMTLDALRGANQDAILRSYIAQRDDRFRNLQMNDFLKGWLQRDRDLETFLNVYQPPSTR